MCDYLGGLREEKRANNQTTNLFCVEMVLFLREDEIIFEVQK